MPCVTDPACPGRTFTAMHPVSRILCALFVLALVQAVPAAPAVNDSHGIAMHGDLKYPEDFTHLDYANPQAPKGGRLRMAVVSPGGFDSLNPWIPKGVAAAGISQLYDALMEGSLDEPFSQYGLVAARVEWPQDRRWIVFHLRPEARFHDGVALTSADVVYTFELLTTRGSPFWRSYYRDVQKVEALDPHRVRFSFADTGNRELPLIVGQMPVLPKHYWETRDFTAANLEAPLGSGPYRVKNVQPGRSITYERVADYWAKDLALNKGRYNFGEIEYAYYRDDTVALEALKAGEYDLRVESSAKNWATAYDAPAVRSGQLRRHDFPLHLPAGMQGFFMNSRREVFADPRVRRAINHAFDFEWANRNLMYGAYTRTDSYFENSDLAASGLPGADELALLEPFRAQLPAELFDTPFTLPVTDGSGNNRDNLLKATQLLAEAGWAVRDGKLVDAQGRQMAFEILLDNPLFEPHAQSFVKNLVKLGIDARIRSLPDTQQFENRLRKFDFDMIVMRAGQSNSPGNEQRDYWSGAAADMEDSRNYAGVKSPVVDALVEKLVQAQTRAELETAARALDRVLLWGWYVVPHWHLDKARVAWWDRLGMPETVPDTGPSPDYWWFDSERDAALRSGTAKTGDTGEASTDAQETNHGWFIALLIGGGLLAVGFLLWRRQR